MRYLIDTQILIWALNSPDRLAADIRHLLQGNAIFISQISFLEIAIKQKIGKLPEFDLSAEALLSRVEQDGFNVLPLKISHIAAYDRLTLFQNHRDPFDRILLATALSESMPIISADENFALYSPPVQLIEN